MPTTNYPKVSVVISTYNRPDKLDRALESVCNQTFSDFEVVVVDDCSTTHDENHAVLEKWDANFTSRGIDMCAFRLGENSGYQCAPKNRGIEQSRGDYIAYLDDDNTWRPDHLQVCVDAIEADLSTDLVYSRISYHVAPEIRPTIVEKFGRDIPDGDAPGTEWNPTLLSQANYIDTSTILHSKGAFWRLVRETGFGWDESLRRFGDWNFVWRWASHGMTGKLVNKVTLDYHIHEGSMQVTRPAMEVPICFNYASYQGLRADRNSEISLVS